MTTSAPSAESGSKLRRYGPLALVWAALIGFFAAIQLSTDRFAGNDSYYHIKYAYLLWHEGALWDFRWLQGTNFRDVWVDTEMLYHVLLIPFTLFGNLYVGAKAASAFYGGTALFAAFLVIRGFGDPGSGWRRHAWLFALLLAASSKTMLYRLSTTRAPAASVAFMMGGLWLMHRRAYKALFVLGFFYAWMYHVSVLLVPFAIFFAVGQRIESGRWDVRPTLGVGLGILAGMVFNPYFPHSIITLVEHVLEIGIGGSSLPKGNEWAAYDTWYMATTTNVAWGVAIAGIVAIGGTRRAMTGRTFGLFFCAAMMAAVFFKSRRFVEYFPVFMIVFGASAIHDFVADPDSWWPRLRDALGRKIYVLQALLTVGLVAFGAHNNWRASREAAQNAWPWRLAGAAKWLEEHTPEESQVYNAEWDVFPELIFHNHHNSWTLGLDPNFTYFLDPRLYYISDRLGRGQLAEAGRWIKEDFGSDYAVATTRSGLKTAARFANSGLEQVYEDEHAMVWKVVPIDAVRTVEGELSAYEAEPADARCEHTEPKGGMGSASARGLLMCKLDSGQLTLRYPIEVPRAGTYSLEGRFLTGPTPAEATVRVGGQPVGDPVSLRDDRTRIGNLQRLGEVELPAGESTVEVRFSATPGNYTFVFGLDYIRLRRQS